MTGSKRLYPGVIRKTGRVAQFLCTLIHGILHTMEIFLDLFPLEMDIIYLGFTQETNVTILSLTRI
ncbi:hypothetical protein O3M35_008855 [Rhynocoris fuscipes]|uniref:Uncharacterized protein n=1 Tax=Rhynocoris fuscipes TaxID=488301 RepID=A0AAW1D902_9HEMI